MIFNTELKLKQAYEKLLAFRTEEGGFDWYKQKPAHVGISAYALMQLTEMQKISPSVDSVVVKDLRNWIMSKKTGFGTF